MVDPACLANTLLYKTLKPFFGERLAKFPHLGRELLSTIKGSLKAEGLHDESHAEEIFARMLTRALGFLRRHGGSAVMHIRGWLHTIRRHETSRYLIELVEKDGASLEALLEGDKDLPAVPLLHEERINLVVREALKTLPPRHREFLELDLSGVEESEIRKRMGIKSDGYWRQLKHQATKGLKDAILILWDNFTDSIL